MLCSRILLLIISYIAVLSWSRKWQPTPVFLPGESHGQRNLAGYSPWGRKELDMTEHACMGSLGASDGGSCPPTQIESGLWWEMRMGGMTRKIRGARVGKPYQDPSAGTL